MRVSGMVTALGGASNLTGHESEDRAVEWQQHPPVHATDQSARDETRGLDEPGAFVGLIHRPSQPRGARNLHLGLQEEPTPDGIDIDHAEEVQGLTGS